MSNEKFTCWEEVFDSKILYFELCIRVFVLVVGNVQKVRINLDDSKIQTFFRYLQTWCRRTRCRWTTLTLYWGTLWDNQSFRFLLREIDRPNNPKMLLFLIRFEIQTLFFSVITGLISFNKVSIDVFRLLKWFYSEKVFIPFSVSEPQHYEKSVTFCFWPTFLSEFTFRRNYKQFLPSSINILVTIF